MNIEEFKNRLELTLSMCRIEEFFESPHLNINNTVFSFEDFLETYANSKGEIDFFSFWEGFNVPKQSIVRFFNSFELSKREKTIESVWLAGDFEYLIATDIDSDPTVLDHELAHARFTLDTCYRKQVIEIVKSMPDSLSARLQRGLLAAGYSNDALHLLDETHAYLLTSDEKELTETFKSVSFDERYPFQKKLKSCAEQ